MCGGFISSSCYGNPCGTAFVLNPVAMKKCMDTKFERMKSNLILSA